MTSEQIKQVVELYQQQLSARGVLPVKFATNGVVPSGVVALSHVSWMLGEIPSMLEAGDREKAMRWLCFIQGVLWMTGRRTIDQMRDDNRSA